jgi:outer membrane lipoprotein-sorting protein
MRLFPLFLLAVVATLGAQDIQGIVDRLTATYGGIETFSAKADVFLYDG